MGSISDLLKEVPLSAVLKERVALAEQKFAEAERRCVELSKLLELAERRNGQLERENVLLRAQASEREESCLHPATSKVLQYLFNSEFRACELGLIARNLGLERNLAKYHLEQLEELGLASSSHVPVVGGEHWALTTAGRRHVVEVAA